jgi:hypothetical protein
MDRFCLYMVKFYVEQMVLLNRESANQLFLRSVKQDISRDGEEREVRGNKWTGGSHEIRSISVCNHLIFYLERYLLS